MSIILNSDRLSVEIPMPGEAPNVTTRFDRAGFITRVVLDGKISFTAAEPDGLSHPRTGGVGLCSEFKSKNVYEETKAGDFFPKFGIGLLRKPDDEPYSFYRVYECEPFEVVTQVLDSKVSFITEPREVNGFALRNEKTVIAAGAAIIMNMKAENVGKKALEFDEYCHNFITIDDLPTGEDYRLDMPSIADQDGKKSKTLLGVGRGFTYSGYGASAAFLAVAESEIENKPFHWKLSNKKSHAFVKEETSFVPSAIFVWSIDRIISPEVMRTVKLNPGESCIWTRKWTFDYI